MKALAILKRRRDPVIYEVRLVVDAAVVGDYDEWLRDHVREMLALPGFQSANVYRGADLTEDHRAVRVAVYEVRSRRELDSYLHTHAPRMRKEGIALFGNRFTATRRILPLSQYVLPRDLSVLYTRQDISGGLPVCGNCHQPVSGRFCANCGQEDRTYMLSLGELVYEFVGDTFNFDSRFFRTMGPMLFRPGVLTTDYIRGRRQHYLPPVRMYIFVSLIFFFASALLVNFGFTDEMNEELRAELNDNPTDKPAPDDLATREITEEERAKARKVLSETESALGLPAGTLQLPTTDNETPEEAGASRTETGSHSQQSIPAGDYQGPNIFIGNDETKVTGFGDGDFEARLERGADAFRDDPRAFADAVMQQIPAMMFLFLPLIALVLKVLYIGSGRYYVEHLVFTLHFHSAVFVMVLMWLLFEESAEYVAALQPLSFWVTLAVYLYIPVYLYRSLRCVYGQGHLFTVFKYTLLFFSYIIAAATTFVLTLLYTFYLQS